jgi:PIN domain
MHIFIDTNILLGFYETSSDSLIELEKIAVLLKQGKAQLWLPDQVEKEFWKNREGAIEKHLSTFEKGGIMGSVPLLVREHPSFVKLKKSSLEFEKTRAEIIAHVRGEVLKEDTQADRLVRTLFSQSNRIDTSGKIFADANERAMRHLPPGKQDGLGDRINWCALLATVPPDQELHVISEDGDYASEADSDMISSYLRHEWKVKKKSEIAVWKRASKFLASKVPGAANAIEVERTLLVESLEKSPNFATTHKIIAEFVEITRLNPVLAERLGLAICNNSQVYWIVGDPDVKPFVQEFLRQYGETIDATTRTRIQERLGAC